SGTADKEIVLGMVERGGNVRTLHIQGAGSQNSRNASESTLRLVRLSSPMSWIPMTALLPSLSMKSSTMTLST
ncbi:MAG: hypothetical protein ABSH50_29405, partial [Bryobacteraceae bacterium]